jgi:hypothetical protein
MTRMRHLGVGAAALSLAAACAGRLPPCPAAGGPTWTELEGTHFRLRTDQPQPAARAVLADLEHLVAALLSVFGAPPDLDTGKVPAIVVDRGWTDIAPFHVDGFFTHALFQPLVVMPSGGTLYRQQVINHELVHYLSRQVMPRQPPWLAEGLASYYETIEYDAEEGRVTVGRPAPDRLRVVQRGDALNIETMFAATTIGDDPGRFYAAAWITTHYLMNHRRVALMGYEKALHAGATFEAAWTAAFGAQTPAQLAADVRRYMEDGGQYAMLVYRFPPYKPAPPLERPLSDADTHATRALLYVTGGRIGTGVDDREERLTAATRDAKRELDEAIRLDPDHVTARSILHWMLGAPIDLERASAATRAHAGDWRAWLLLADALDDHHDQTGRDGALARVAELARDDRSIEIHLRPASK